MDIKKLSGVLYEMLGLNLSWKCAAQCLTLPFVNATFLPTPAGR